MPITPEQRRVNASNAGKAAHQQGVAHEWTSDEAQAAGRKGGRASAQSRRERAEQAAAARPIGLDSEDLPSA